MAATPTADAVVLVTLMVEWFHANYEDPVESTPYDNGEGGYQYLCDGPYDAHDELTGEFQHALTANFDADELEEIIAAAVAEIEEDGTVDWAKIMPDETIPLLPHSGINGTPAMFIISMWSRNGRCAAKT